jgi:hypothetical protein
VQALAAAHVGAVGDDAQLVVRREPVEDDAVAVVARQVDAASPLRTTSWTAGAVRSTWVLAPTVALEKRTTVVVRKVSLPGAPCPSVRSSSTS